LDFNKLFTKCRIAEYPFSEFSCWRYLKVNSAEFNQDLDAMAPMFNRETLLPPPSCPTWVPLIRS